MELFEAPPPLRVPGSTYALDLDFSFFYCAVLDRPADELA